MKTIKILLLISLMGCSGSKRWSATDMWLLALKEDPNVRQVPIPNHEQHRRILCQNYGQGCVLGSGKRVELKGVEIVVVEFENENLAKEEAIRIGQMYARNWLFDEVINEPVVKSFITRVYEAKDPLEGLKKNSK